jgi:hypothetical protein
VYLVQVLLPVYDNAGRRLPRDLHAEVATELTDRFGGCTAYTRAPAEGSWQAKRVGTVRDDIVVYEVMTEALDRAWWATYRQSLEARFRQQQVVIRAQAIELL